MPVAAVPRRRPTDGAGVRPGDRPLEMPGGVQDDAPERAPRPDQPGSDGYGCRAHRRVPAPWRSNGANWRRSSCRRRSPHLRIAALPSRLLPVGASRPCRTATVRRPAAPWPSARRLRRRPCRRRRGAALHLVPRRSRCPAADPPRLAAADTTFALSHRDCRTRSQPPACDRARSTLSGLGDIDVQAARGHRRRPGVARRNRRRSRRCGRGSGRRRGAARRCHRRSKPSVSRR